MQNIILNEELIIDEQTNNTVSLVESIKNYITDHDCPNLSMDISHLNILEASKVTAVCSTYHWAKYPNGKINWKISSTEIQDLVTPLSLGNINLITAQ